MSATLVNAMSAAVQELIDKEVVDTLPSLDPFQEQISLSWDGVTAGIGRDFKVLHTLYESSTGAFKWCSALGDTLDNTTLSGSLIPGTRDTYPSIDDTVLPLPFQSTISLVGGKGVMPLPLHYTILEKLPANIAKHVGIIAKKTARQIDRALILGFYQVGTKKSQLCTIAGVTVSGATATFEVQEGSVRLFEKGQHVDVYTTGGVQRNTNVQLVVNHVRYIPVSTDTGYGQVQLKTKDGSNISALAGGTIIDTDDVYLWESYDTGPVGPNYWLDDDGTDVFGINLTTHQQLQSVVVSSIGELDETKFNRYMSRLWHAYGFENFPDCLIGSMGVYQALMDNSIGLADRYVRSLGQRNLVNIGFDKPGVAPFMWNGMPIKFYISPFMASDSSMVGTQNGGRLWGLKTRDKNIVRYTLPPPLGSKTSSDFPQSIMFLFGSGGPMGIFAPSLSTTSRYTDWVQANFMTFTAVAPNHMPGFNGSGITEVL